jgi:hypothetical protein
MITAEKQESSYSFIKKIASNYFNNLGRSDFGSLPSDTLENTSDGRSVESSSDQSLSSILDQKYHDISGDEFPILNYPSLIYKIKHEDSEDTEMPLGSSSPVFNDTRSDDYVNISHKPVIESANIQQIVQKTALTLKRQRRRRTLNLQKQIFGLIKATKNLDYICTKVQEHSQIIDLKLSINLSTLHSASNKMINTYNTIKRCDKATK